MPASRIAASSAMPVMIPGNAIGSTNNSVSAFVPRIRLRASAKAASVPRQSAASVARPATPSDRRIAAQMSLRSNASANQRNVRPGGGKS